MPGFAALATLPGTRAPLAYNTTIDTLDPFAVALYRKIFPHPNHLPLLIEKVKYMLLTQPNFSRDELRQIACPALVVSGDAEELIRTEHTLASWNSIPGAELRWIHGAGPFLLLEKPAEVEQIILDFLSSATAAAHPAELTPRDGRRMLHSARSSRRPQTEGLRIQPLVSVLRLADSDDCDGRRCSLTEAKIPGMDAAAFPEAAKKPRRKAPFPLCSNPG